jgi:hypothetical protein
MKGVEHAMRPQIKVEAVSADAMSWLFEDPFNPPALGDEGFDEEYWHAQDAVRLQLERMGGVCDPMHGNFVMNDSHRRSRWMSVELSSEALVGTDFLPAIIETLNELPMSYAVYVSHECPEDPIFHLVVFRDRIVHQTSSSKWLRQLVSGIGW